MFQVDTGTVLPPTGVCLVVSYVFTYTNRQDSFFLFLVTQPPPTVAPKNFRATFTSETTITFSWDGVTRRVESIIDVNMYIIRCYERNNNIVVRL